MRRLPQYYKGIHFGALLDTYQRSAGMLSAVQYIATLVVLYTTTLQGRISFVSYMVVVFVSIAVMMVMVYILGTPSSFAFWSQQIWKHDNPMRYKLESMETRQNAMDKKLDAISNKLGISNDEK